MSPVTADPARRPGICDAHVHLYGPLSRYPIEGVSPYTVPDLGVPELLQRMDAAGVERAVIVHPAVSGRDNRRTLDALAEHPARFRGVLVPPLTPPDEATLAAWHARGVRGLRFSYTASAQAGMALDENLVARIAEYGWHAQVHLEPNTLLAVEDRLSALKAPVVIDHMARIQAGQGIAHPAFGSLLRLLDRGHAWVKLSAPMRLSTAPTSPYGDVTPMAKALIAHAPERVIWGSDWPHVNLATPSPPYASLLALAHAWTDSSEARQRLLVGNACALYGFPPPAALDSGH